MPKLTDDESHFADYLNYKIFDEKKGISFVARESALSSAAINSHVRGLKPASVASRQKYAKAFEAKSFDEFEKTWQIWKPKQGWERHVFVSRGKNKGGRNGAKSAVQLVADMLDVKNPLANILLWNVVQNSIVKGLLEIEKRKSTRADVAGLIDKQEFSGRKAGKKQPPEVKD